jgi:hypothetical protein
MICNINNMIIKLKSNARISFLEKRFMFFSNGGGENFSNNDVADVKSENLEREDQLDSLRDEINEDLNSLSDNLEQGEYGDLLNISSNLSRGNIAYLPSVFGSYNESLSPEVKSIVDKYSNYDKEYEQDPLTDMEEFIIRDAIVTLIKRLQKEAQNSNDLYDESEQSTEKLSDAEQIKAIATMTPENIKDVLGKIDVWKNAKLIKERFGGLYKSGFNLVSSMISFNNDTEEIVIKLPKDHIVDPSISNFKRFDFQDNFITINNTGEIHLHSPNGSLATDLNTISFDEIKDKIYENENVDSDQTDNTPVLSEVDSDFFEQKKDEHINRWTADMSRIGCTIQTDTIVYKEDIQSFTMINYKGISYELNLDVNSRKVTVTCAGKVVHSEENVRTLAEFTSSTFTSSNLNYSEREGELLNSIEDYKFKNKNISVVENSYNKDGDYESCTVNHSRTGNYYSVVLNGSVNSASILLGDVNGDEVTKIEGSSLTDILKTCENNNIFNDFTDVLEDRYKTNNRLKNKTIDQEGKHKESLSMSQQLESISTMTSDNIADVLKKIDLSNDNIVDSLISKFNHYDSKGLYLIPRLIRRENGGIKISLGERRVINRSGTTFDFKDHSIFIDSKGNITLNNPAGDRLKSLNSITMSEVKTDIENAKKPKPIDKPFDLLKVGDILGFKDKLLKKLSLELVENSVKKEDGLIKFTVKNFGVPVEISFNDKVVKLGDKEVKLSDPLSSKPFLATLLNLDKEFSNITV